MAHMHTETYHSHRRATLSLCVSIVTALALSLVASHAYAQLRVVATLPGLAAIASEVGGDHVRVEALASPSEDPHYVDARPNFVVNLSRADLLVACGMELEVGWLPPMQVQARNTHIVVGGRGYVEASQFIIPIGVPTGRVDRSMGDIHAGGNPHFLYDPRAAAQVAFGLGERMALLDPDNADAYRTNAQRFAQALLLYADEAAQRFSELPSTRRRLVSYHDSFVYLAEWLELDVVGHVEPRPGIPPDPGHVAATVTLMRSLSVPLIAQERYYPTGTSETIARMTDAQVVVVASSPDFSRGETYLEHISRLVDQLYGAMAAP